MDAASLPTFTSWVPPAGPHHEFRSGRYRALLNGITHAEEFL